MTIGIYCSASTHINPVFNENARQLAKWMGQKGMTVVNGGSTQGLMEIFSSTIHEYGGKSIGVVPEDFKERGWYNDKNDETVFVENLSDRKEKIKSLSDLIIVFPGGVGSLDELFDAWASYNLDYHKKRIIIANIEGFYEPLIGFLEKLKDEHFLHDFLPKPIIVAEDINQCFEIIDSINSGSEDFNGTYRVY